MEEWRDVVGYEGLYKVSSLGRVYSCERTIHYKNCSYIKKGKILKPSVGTHGYYYLILCVNSKQRVETVHRLVAKAFISNIENKKQVNHIDENKLNNKVDNLEWVTQQENLTYGNVHNRKYKKVSMFSKGGKKLEEFNSLQEAEIKTGVKTASISACLTGRTKTAYGYIWKYV